MADLVIPRDVSNDSIDVLGQDLTNHGGVTHNGMDTVTIRCPDPALDSYTLQESSYEQQYSHWNTQNGADGTWVKIVDGQCFRISFYPKDKPWTDLEWQWNTYFFGGNPIDKPVIKFGDR